MKKKVKTNNLSGCDHRTLSFTILSRRLITDPPMNSKVLRHNLHYLLQVTGG